MKKKPTKKTKPGKKRTKPILNILNPQHPDCWPRPELSTLEEPMIPVRIAKELLAEEIKRGDKAENWAIAQAESEKAEHDLENLKRKIGGMKSGEKRRIKPAWHYNIWPLVEKKAIEIYDNNHHLTNTGITNKIYEYLRCELRLEKVPSERSIWEHVRPILRPKRTSR